MYRMILMAAFMLCASVSGQVMISGDLTSHVDSIIAASPGEDGPDLDKYAEPTTTESQIWRQIVQAMLSGNYSTAHSLAGTIDYRVVQFTDTPPAIDQVYFLLERTPASTDKYWGAFVFNPTPSRSKLVIQAPHPLQNRNTGNQGVRVFQTTDAWIFCVAGTHKCNSTSYSPCDGSSTSCADTSEPYRNGDQAHAETATFQVTTEEILAYRPNAIILQPHGYTKGEGGPDDPDIIMSNGSTLTPPSSYLTQLRTNLLAQDNTLTFKIAHLDLAYTYFLGRDNLQGRLVNGSVDPCNTAATANSGNFIHLEQAWDKLRDTEANWDKLADAAALTFAPDVVVTSAQSGSWTDPNTWAGGVVPTQSDSVLIASGHVISIDDRNAACQSITFADTSAHIDLNAKSTLSIYGNMALAAQTHNVFSAGWSSDSAYVRFAGGATQTLSGWSTSAGSTSFRDIIVEKDSGTVVQTAGTNMRFAIQNSLDIISGRFIINTDDELEARWASSALLTGNRDLTITVHADGEFRLLDGATGTHWVRSEAASAPIGPMTVYGIASFADGSSSDISMAGITVKSGGTLELGLNLWSSTNGATFNPDSIMVEAGGSIYATTTSNIWFDTTILVLSQGATYRTTGSSTVFPANFVNNGKVRYQRASSTNQNVVDVNYYDLEMSFSDGPHNKVWTLAGSRNVTDSLIINNNAIFAPAATTPQVLTIGNTLRLTSGTFDNSNANVTINMADGAVISRATGTIANTPTFAGVVDLKYTSTTTSVTTGEEMPGSSSVLRDLTVFTTGQTLSLGSDATVNRELTLSAGTFDNDGVDNDYSLTMADGAAIRRATADLTTAPSFDGVVDVEYISTVSTVTTGAEIPAGSSVLRNLTVTGDKGVTLGSNATVNGAVNITGSDLNTGSFTLTLAPGATITESNGYSVIGNLVTTRTLSQSTAETFGGIGLQITANGGAPGSTVVTRVTGQPQTVNGNPSIGRYFDISPTNNTGLGATMVFRYDQSELNALDENTLVLYASSDGGNTWSIRGGLRDTAANTVTLSGVNAFSRWTLSGLVMTGQAISAQSGSWTNPTTWLGNAIPEETDDVLIMSGHTISVDDTMAFCEDLTFGGADALIDMNAKSRLTIYGNMTLFNETHNVFSAGWSADSAYVMLAGNLPATLAGWSTSGGSTSFRDLIIAKDSGVTVRTGGNAMRFAVQHSFEIRSGIFILAVDDDFESRWTSSGNFTADQQLTTVVQAGAEFHLEDGTNSHWIRSNTGSAPIGPMTIYGEAEFIDASSSDISINNIAVKAGGTLHLNTGLGTTTSGPMFNPGTITIDSGAIMLQETTSEIWFDTSIVILSRGGLYKTTSSTTVFPPTLVNDGRVRYQRNPSSATTDQVVIDTSYFDVEFSFAGNNTKKLWAVNANRTVADSLEVNNSATLVLTGNGSTIQIDSMLRLTSGSIDNSAGTANLTLANGAEISRATGTISNAPVFAGVVDVRYTSSLASVPTGPELPVNTSTLRNLTVYSPDQTVTLSDDVTVNSQMTLSSGTFDNNGSSDDKVLHMAALSTIRRATGALAAAPTFDGMVNVEYISTLDSVISGPELPVATGVLQNLSILGNKGVRLGSNVTVNGQLHLADSILNTNGFTATLGSSATILEDSIWVVQGRVGTTRTVATGVLNTFGGLGLSVNAAGTAPGSTQVVRVTGTAKTVAGAPGILRYFEVRPTTRLNVNAAIVFHYSERELNGLTEATLTLYNSLDSGATWSPVTGTLDTAANTITVASLKDLGWLTAGGPTTSCCIGFTGNVNKSALEIPDLSDLSLLISYLTVTPRPVLPCIAEANVNGSVATTPDLSDLSLLISYLTVTPRPVLPNCQ
ncbi:MAG: hypothetical protein IPH75_10725 [bacterium]|nr:hypothetical protein [bacterium]